MNFRFFSKGEFFLALASGVLLFVKLRWRGDTYVCGTGRPYLQGHRLLGNSWEPAVLPRRGYHSATRLLFSSCRELGSGDCTPLPHLQGAILRLILLSVGRKGPGFSGRLLDSRTPPPLRPTLP